MRHFTTVQTPVLTANGFTCDCCKKKVAGNDVFETQEAHHIEFTGGYGSVFGDGATIQCDLCQDCLHTMIKSYMRVTPSPH